MAYPRNTTYETIIARNDLLCVPAYVIHTIRYGAVFILPGLLHSYPFLLGLSYEVHHYKNY
jgi:hypothetical protein